jgi:hypothetical protein
MRNGKNRHVTKAGIKKQKEINLRDEFAGLRELEELGVKVGKKADELVEKLEKAGVLEKLEKNKSYNAQTCGTNSHLKKQANVIGLCSVEKWDDVNCVFEMELESGKSTEEKPKKKTRRTNKKASTYKPESSYKWHSNLKERWNTATPTQWFEEAENEGLLNGNGKCAKRLRQLAKRDRRKLKEVTESRKNVRKQFGKKLWKHGMIGLAPVGKPRGVKKISPACEKRPLIRARTLAPVPNHPVVLGNS